MALAALIVAIIALCVALYALATRGPRSCVHGHYTASDVGLRDEELDILHGAGFDVYPRHGAKPTCDPKGANPWENVDRWPY